MNDEGLAATPPTPHEHTIGSAPRWIKYLVVLVFLLWAVGAFADIYFFKRYLPSHVWLETIEPFATILGAVTALICTLCVFLGFRDEERRTGKRTNDVFSIIILIVMVFVLYFPTANLFRRGLPAMIASAWGDQVEHPFVIGDVDDRDRKHCHRPIVLRDMPVTTTLCEMPSEFRAQLQPGMSVVFIGKGTWMGLFVEDFRIP